TVGRHLAPHSSQLSAFLNKFYDTYGNLAVGSAAKIIASAASHHRLAWIHPFLDGNGRVIRLFTHAFLMKAGGDGHGMWTVSRGLARNRDAYMSALAGADKHRQGDLDGRGNLSQQGLVSFCRFFLETALDQIVFMNQLLDLDKMKNRIAAYVERQVAFGRLRKNSGYLLEAALVYGELPRGEAPRILNMPERSARRVLKELLDKNLLISDTVKGPVRLVFPAKVTAYYFPRLYPEGVEAELQK
ncbi:MAG: Fic family protein, partial [Desulfobulbaceae bacterium]|nr:Fic family protein [Desulfobulbaceae bacterium]